MASSADGPSGQLEHVNLGLVHGADAVAEIPEDRRDAIR
jgi:hypothetical protein